MFEHDIKAWKKNPRLLIAVLLIASEVKTVMVIHHHMFIITITTHDTAHSAITQVCDLAQVQSSLCAAWLRLGCPCKGMCSVLGFTVGTCSVRLLNFLSRTLIYISISLSLPSLTTAKTGSPPGQAYPEALSLSERMDRRTFFLYLCFEGGPGRCGTIFPPLLVIRQRYKSTRRWRLSPELEDQCFGWKSFVFFQQDER